MNFPKGGLHLYGDVNWGTEPWLITIGQNVHITARVQFITHDGGTLVYRRLYPDLEVTRPISVGNDVYIGNDAKLMPGVKVGNNVIIVAGSIVTKDVPDNSVVAGVPAKFIKTSDEYLEKLQRESLGLGHLSREEKDRALMKHFGYEGNSKGIYL